MNHENLHTLIDRYEENLYLLNDDRHNEKFKWRAVKCFQDVWFAPDAKTRHFAEVLRDALKESSVLIDNSQTHPANGVVRLAEKAPEEVRHLFETVLFADDGGDLSLRQAHMEQFEQEMNALLHKHDPTSWKYEQNRHAVSCYLALYAPKDNYIYKYSAVEAFAQHIEFGKDIGSGGAFKLAHYYELCDGIVEALRDHQGLLDKHAALMDGSYYKDDSLHLLAFDIIYCAFTYGLFKDLKHKPKKEAIQAYTQEQKRIAEEEKRQAELAALDEKIWALERQMDDYRMISLVGVQVHQKAHGDGIVTRQKDNTITVRYADGEVDHIIHKKYLWRPTFEDDAQIVEAMTDFDEKLKEVDALRKARQALQ